MIIQLIFKNELVKIKKKFNFKCDLSLPVPVYTYHKNEIDDDFSEVDDDFWPSVNTVKVKQDSNIQWLKCTVIATLCFFYRLWVVCK